MTKYFKRFCKKCDAPIATRGSHFNTYDKEGLCSMCGKYCEYNNTLGIYAKIEEVLVKTTKDRYNMNIYYNF